MTSYEEAKKIAESVAKESFDLGWNTAVMTISQSIENMKVFGDTAASFAIFVKEFQRDMAFPTTPTADTEEQQPTEVQPKQP
jgi:TRAP-type uncharacterized transport system substrate-binding protein